MRARGRVDSDPAKLGPLGRQRSAIRDGMIKEALKDPTIRTQIAELERQFPEGSLSNRLPAISFSGYESNALFHNRGDGTFEEIGVASGAGRREDGRGVAVADLDRDGRLDLVISNFLRRPIMVLSNQGTGEGAWLSVRLHGNQSNRFGIGARVTLRAGKRAWVDEVEAGNGYLSSQPSDLHFGLGDAETVSVTVRWPTGVEQQFENVKARAFVTVTEGEKALQREEPREPAPRAPRRPPRTARVGDPMKPVRLDGPLGMESVELPPSKGRVALVLFSQGCFQCQDELEGAAALDARAASLPDTRVVWGCLDAEEQEVLRYLVSRKIERPFVMVKGETRSALLGAGRPPLPIALVLSPDGIEAKFIGREAARRALDWIEK